MKKIKTRRLETYYIKDLDTELCTGDMLIIKGIEQLVINKKYEHDCFEVNTIYKEGENIRKNSFSLFGKGKRFLRKYDTFLVKPDDERYFELNKKLNQV